MEGTIHMLRHESQLLKNNPLGDSSFRDISVYVPSGKGPFPLVLVLPGFGSDATSMISSSPFKQSTAQLFDRAIAAGNSHPAVLAMPACTTLWGGSQFVDSPATGPYQSYLAEEVISFLTRELALIDSRDARAAVGRSSGGFGALRLAFDRDDALSVCASHAGDALFDVSMRPMLASAAVALRKAGDMAALAAMLRDEGPKGSVMFDAAFVMACSAAYSKEQGESFPFAEFPVDAGTGLVRQELWNHWLENDPVHRLRKLTSAPKHLSKVFVDCGDLDEHALQIAADALVSELKRLGQNVAQEEFAGGHRGTSYRYETTLPSVVAALPCFS